MGGARALLSGSTAFGGRRGMRAPRAGRLLPFMAVAVMALAACDPAAMRTGISERAARSVIVNVLVNQYPRPQAEAATECVMANASPAETESLARDVGTRSGTSTVTTIRQIADRPATVSCLAGRGLPPVAVVP